MLTVDVTPLSSMSTSGMDATACPDMSVARSVSVELGISMIVDFDDRAREKFTIILLCPSLPIRPQAPIVSEILHMNKKITG